MTSTEHRGRGGVGRGEAVVARVGTAGGRRAAGCGLRSSLSKFRKWHVSGRAGDAVFDSMEEFEFENRACRDTLFMSPSTSAVTDVVSDKYHIPIQEVGNRLVTPLGLRVSMDGGDQLL
ncbi:hypothetical protein EVAR_42030_1 [Eumeta japonica]|uniref:Uncharacterized protein n=1 Tax=Eumeta variegata TaxID=151549 RepID=A0A4C1YAS4_EUMVA|nr:hypothetical protein EVAR_42030_1 [Eumeta japonica]